MKCLHIKIAELVYSFTNLNNDLCSQIKKHFGGFVINNFDRVSSYAKNYVTDRNFANIWAFKTFFRKKLSRDLLQYDKLLMHSAAFVFKNKTLIFLGESGEGKSTIVDKMKNYAVILNDETNIIDVKNRIIYPTPFWGDIPLFSYKKRNFDNIFVLKKSERNRIAKLAQKIAFYYVLKTVLIDVKSHAIKKHLFDLAFLLIKNINFYLFSYKLDTNLLHLLNRVP